MSSGLDVLLPLFHAGCNSCSITAARSSVLCQVWSSHAVTFMIHRLCLRFIAAFSPHGSLPRVPSRPLRSLQSWILSLVSLLLRLPKLPPSRCTLFLQPTTRWYPIVFVISPRGALYWHSTWYQLFWFPLDRPVIDLSWLISHGALRTAHRLVITFGMVDVPLACFCSPLVLETLDHLFFYCPLAQSILSWLQALMLRCSALVPSLTCRHVLFGFNQDEFLCVPCIFVYMLNVCTFFLWQARNDYRFRDVAPIAADVLAKFRVRVRFYLLPFLNAFFLLVAFPFLSASGVRVVSLRLLLMVVWQFTCKLSLLFAGCWPAAFLPGPFISPYSAPSASQGFSQIVVCRQHLFVSLFFFPACWSPALLPGPFSPSHSAPSASWSPSRSCVCCQLVLSYRLSCLLTCPLVLFCPLSYLSSNVFV